MTMVYSHFLVINMPLKFLALFLANFLTFSVEGSCANSGVEQNFLFPVTNGLLRLSFVSFVRSAFSNAIAENFIGAEFALSPGTCHFCNKAVHVLSSGTIFKSNCLYSTN